MYHSQLPSQDFYPLWTEHPLSTEYLIAQFPVAPSEERKKTKAISSSCSINHPDSHKTMTSSS
jgi:hypothetical protein